MAKIIDLSTIVKEPLIFKMPHCDDTFEIPGEVSTSFVFKMMKMYEDMENKEMTEVEQIKAMQRIVIDILKLDRNNAEKVNVKYVEENLDSITYLRIIIEAMMKHIVEIQQDENLNSPKSDK